jgi:phosphomannomutase
VRSELKLKSMGAIDISPLKSTKIVLGKKVVKVDDSDGLKFFLEDTSWLMLRTSGTEPIIRIYSESQNEAVSFKLLDFGKELILKNVV